MPSGPCIATKFEGETALAGAALAGEQPPRKLSIGSKKSFQLCSLCITPDEGRGARGEG
jgi:hypothetical protein